MIEAINDEVQAALEAQATAQATALADGRRRKLTENEEQRIWRMLLEEMGDKGRPTQGDYEAFCDVVERTGLDPFARQVTPMVRRDRGRAKLFPLITIDGARLIGQRTGEFAGRVGPAWCGEDGVWRDVWLDQHPPAAARVGLRRAGHVEPTWCVATWAEFGGSSDSWRKMPAHMLAKVAEAHAWRVLFPAELSGIYTVDEFAKLADETRETIGAPAGARSRRQQVEDWKDGVRREVAMMGPHEHWPPQPLDDDDPFADDPDLEPAPPAPAPASAPDVTALKKAMFRINERAVEALAGGQVNDAVRTGLRWALMSMAATRAAKALGLEVGMQQPPTPLDRHAVALARRIDRDYDGYVVDVTVLDPEELAKLAQAMGVDLGLAMGVRVEVDA